LHIDTYPYKSRIETYKEVIMRGLLTGIVAGLILAGSASAAPASGYKVTPVTAPADGQMIVHDMAWRCAGGSCSAARTGQSTDTTICSALARAMGPLQAFAVGPDAFDQPAIEKCNRRVR
jgi:hypothetical protein